jgi:excisionase family DNA binding protein
MKGKLPMPHTDRRKRTREAPREQTMSGNLNGEKFSTIQQLAERLSVSARTVRRWIKNGTLIAHDVEGLLRIAESDLKAFIGAHRDI